MKTRNKQLVLETKGINYTGINFKIILFGAILLITGICTSCDPDDETIDGTSGATSQAFIQNNFQSIINEQPILMS